MKGEDSGKLALTTDMCIGFEPRRVDMVLTGEPGSPSRSALPGDSPKGRTPCRWEGCPRLSAFPTRCRLGDAARVTPRRYTPGASVQRTETSRMWSVGCYRGELFALADLLTAPKATQASARSRRTARLSQPVALELPRPSGWISHASSMVRGSVLGQGGPINENPGIAA